MKKIIVLITVALCLIVAGAALAGAALVAADFSFSGLASEKLEEVSYIVDGDFSHIMIATDSHDVTLAPSTDSVCRIVGTESDGFKIDAEIEDSTLVVKLKDDRKWYDHIGIFTAETYITLYLPESVYSSLTVATLTGDVLIPENFTFDGAAIAASTADISVFSAIKGELALACSTGDITVSGVNPTKLDASVSTGDIHIENVTTEGKITLECSSGDVELHGVEAGEIVSKGTTSDLLLKNVIVENEINIKRSTGDVTLTSTLSGSLVIETSSGDVELNLSDAESIDIKTSTGKVDAILLSDKIFKCSSSSGSIRIPDTHSGGVCKVTTSTGNIHITID